jgi:release factor glutamine methyltransferase
MTIQEILSGSGMQRIDAEVLLAHALGKERTWLYAHGEAKPDKQALDRWQRLQARRNRGEPVAYIVERQEFFGLPFLVNNNVLIPRPATEGLVQTALDMMKGEWGNGTRDIDADIVALSHLFGVPTATTTVVDVGSGSGCIAVTLASKMPRARIVAVDVSAEALAVGKENARRHGVHERITFIHDDGCAVLKRLQDAFVVVSNPPYIPAALRGTLAVADHEPHSALFAGEHGLDVLQPLVRHAAHNPHCSAIALECRKDQVHPLKQILER